MTAPASAWPANFVGASRPYLSSSIPSTTSTSAPDSSACGSVDPSNTELMSGSWLATSIAAMSPAAMPRPPRRGVGSSWTSRSRTSAIAPHHVANLRATGVAR